jgi:hypothetical protein
MQPAGQCSFGDEALTCKQKSIALYVKKQCSENEKRNALEVQVEKKVTGIK